MSNADWATLVLVVSFILMVSQKVPIAFSIAISTVLGWLFVLRWNFEAVFQTVAKDMWHGIDTYALLAIPLFIFSGLCMGEGGIARRLVDFANVLVGRLVGGLSYATVMACMLFGAVSGSATAATSSIGAFMIPEMMREGYERNYSTALTLSAATLGLVIPPSNVMIIYAVAWGDVGGRQVNVAAMFMGGFLPGVIIGLALMVVAGIHAYRHGYKPFGGVGWREGFRRFERAFLSLLLLIIVLGGILAGFFTATEAGAVAVLYSLFLAMVVYRRVGGRELYKILLQTAVTTAFLFLLIAASKAMGTLMVRLEIPQNVSAALLELTENRILLLIIINLILLAVGTFMDMTPAVLIFTPIFAPMVVGQLGMDPIHFGVIMIVNLCIGLCTPPVGTVLFVGCGVGGTTITKLVKPMLPFYVALVGALFVITYIPQSWILWLPSFVD